MPSLSSMKRDELVKEEYEIQLASLPPADLPSCMSLFDKWAACFSVGQQCTYIYRYGTLNDCKPKLEDFKYCLTLKGLDKQEKYEKWIQRRAEIGVEKRLSGSSEDVWELRRDLPRPSKSAS